MVDNVVGMMLGAAIDRRDGDSGVKGAVVGAVTESTLRVGLPLAITFAIGWAVQFAARKAWEAATDRDASTP